VTVPPLEVAGAASEAFDRRCSTVGYAHFQNAAISGGISLRRAMLKTWFYVQLLYATRCNNCTIILDVVSRAARHKKGRLRPRRTDSCMDNDHPASRRTDRQTDRRWNKRLKFLSHRIRHGMAPHGATRRRAFTPNPAPYGTVPCMRRSVKEPQQRRRRRHGGGQLRQYLEGRAVAGPPSSSSGRDEREVH